MEENKIFMPRPPMELRKKAEEKSQEVKAENGAPQNMVGSEKNAGAATENKPVELQKFGADEIAKNENEQVKTTDVEKVEERKVLPKRPVFVAGKPVFEASKSLNDEAEKKISINGDGIRSTIKEENLIESVPTESRQNEQVREYIGDVEFAPAENEVAVKKTEKGKRSTDWNGIVNWFGLVVSLGLVAVFVYLLVL